MPTQKRPSVMSMNRGPDSPIDFREERILATGEYGRIIARRLRRFCAPAHITQNIWIYAPGQATGPGRSADMRASERKHARIARSLALQLQLAANLSRQAVSF